MPDNRQLRFSLSIGREQWLRYYAGHANAVYAVTDTGKSLQLPASAMRPFISHNGVHGLFVISFDADFRLLSVERIGANPDHATKSATG